MHLEDFKIRDIYKLIKYYHECNCDVDQTARFYAEQDWSYVTNPRGRQREKEQILERNEQIFLRYVIFIQSVVDYPPEDDPILGLLIRLEERIDRIESRLDSHNF